MPLPPQQRRESEPTRAKLKRMAAAATQSQQGSTTRTRGQAAGGKGVPAWRRQQAPQQKGSGSNFMLHGSGGGLSSSSTASRARQHGANTIASQRRTAAGPTPPALLTTPGATSPAAALPPRPRTRQGSGTATGSSDPEQAPESTGAPRGQGGTEVYLDDYEGPQLLPFCDPRNASYCVSAVILLFLLPYSALAIPLVSHAKQFFGNARDCGASMVCLAPVHTVAAPHTRVAPASSGGNPEAAFRNARATILGSSLLAPQADWDRAKLLRVQTDQVDFTGAPLVQATMQLSVCLFAFCGTGSSE